MLLFDLFLYFILIVKLIFLYASFRILIMKKNYSDKLNYYTHLAGFTHTIFMFLMSILLIMLFRPSDPKSVSITGETKTSLFIFGILILVGIDYESILSEWKFLI